MLQQRGAKEVVPALEKWVAALDASDPKSEHCRLEGLWTYQSLDMPDVKLLSELLVSKTPQIRAAATRVIGDWLAQLPNAIDLLAASVADDHPRVRLEAVRVLAGIKSPRAIEIAMRALDKPRDKDMDYALWLTARDTESVWMPALTAGQLTFDDKPAHATFVLRSVKSAGATASLAKMYRADHVPADERGEVVQLLGTVGGADEAKLAYDVATAADSPVELRLTALSSLEQCARRGVPPKGADATKIVALIGSPEEKVSVAAIQIAGAWREVDANAALVTAAASPHAKPAVRRAAVAALTDLGGGTPDVFRNLDTPDQPFDVRVAALNGLSGSDLPDASKRAVALLASAPEKTDPSPLVAALLKREGGGDALAAALTAGKRLPAPIAKAALKHVESAGRDEPKLLALLRSASGASAIAATKLSKDEMAKFVSDVTRYGDAARGEAIFRRADMSCFKCHAIQGAGGQLGPDLGSIGASSPVDYLIESLLDPNKAIKDGYNSVIVKTKDGDVQNGIKVAQDAGQVVLRDAVTDRIAIPLDKVRSERPGGSLMPNGLMDTLPSWEQTNLLRFLSELGKPGPFGPGNPQYVRRWRVLPADAAAKLVSDPTPLKSRESAVALPWTPAYTLVSGDLPADATATPGQTVAFARSEIEVTSPGRIRLHVGEAKGLTMWIADRAVGASADVDADLPVGIHAITFRIDVGDRGQGLRLEVRDAPGSTAAARPVGGR